MPHHETVDAPAGHRATATSDDRQAIETWLLTHDTSPKSGEVLSSNALVPNHNLKRLVDDLVREGGARPTAKMRRKD